MRKMLGKRVRNMRIKSTRFEFPTIPQDVENSAILQRGVSCPLMNSSENQNSVNDLPRSAQKSGMLMWKICKNP